MRIFLQVTEENKQSKSDSNSLLLSLQYHIYIDILTDFLCEKNKGKSRGLGGVRK